ncbi:phosphate transporter subunit; membrane component of ABC superfamily [Thiomonas arsenitoxydans]|jgi:phosphate transport system permease protein|uniref:Phosphate transport system permease protein PstA n=1 Tax=Thiomonas arsenitoxydans (strain DSM 22701 / CIP 110005 / 3As) TaxID=426114 RepID=D6CU25_THIA3|nr:MULTISPECIES: phosphate ABC transporter permease PstA [Thiomonas]CQR41286.1 phosphate transporter subunit; membrane component of ABC superfamily [Thiomonas sp. CB3]OZB72351.1 MAG: phosphate ABC transporter, permease protein PstA [Thiomonas sp. 13-64-67]CAZ88794.1 Phosphate transport system permease protein pstA [Thiomonas arsenitoxydans]CQR26331.1 phosphate transporter subunit; membrane component of ABC superfamily [Thiomonas arsenitoxydans]CQR28362.1 phosphate transporter subunit; membrane
MMSLYTRRQLINKINMIIAVLMTAFGIFWVIWILWTTARYGSPALNLHLFTQDTPPPGAEGGGLRNAFVGSFILLGIALVIGTPIGILAGTWLGEFAVKRKLGGVVRFLNDILLSAPSIVVGLFAYAILVDPLGHFSAFSGGVALALILIPVVVRTTDEMLRLVPGSLREAAIALGTPYWKMVTKITWKAASTGILTGVILGVARISGETAPLLFTALNNQYFSSDVWHPMANLPVVIFQFAMSPYANWQQMAWAGAFVAVVFILILSLGSRWLISRGGVKS